MWIASALLGTAFGRETCTPLQEPELRAMVLDAQSSIDRGDIELPSSILDKMKDRLVCLAFSPEPRMWADLMVALAIVEFSRGGDWQAPMAAALRIRPGIDRGVGPGHPLARWEPPEPEPSGPPVPSGTRLYIDGAPSPVLPPDKGLYLVQKTDGRFWETLLLSDGALPPGWVETPVERPPHIASFGRAGLAFGGDSLLQSPYWETDIYPQVDTRRAAVGAQGELQITFFSPFGVLGHGAMQIFPEYRFDAWLSAIWSWRGLSLGAGPGWNSLTIAEYSYGEDGSRSRDDQPFRIIYPQASAMLRSGKQSRWDLLLSGGATGALVRYEFGAGLLLPEIAGERYRFGLHVDARTGTFVQQGISNRLMRVSSSQLLLRLDWVRGEY